VYENGVWALATNFTAAPQCAHIAEFPGSTGRSTARLFITVELAMV